MIPAANMRSLRPSVAALLAVSCAALLGGCRQRARDFAPLVVVRTSPVLGDPTQPVLLNDALTVYFSEDLRSLSVTPDSVTLLDEQGYRVPGRLETGNNWVSFIPAPPLAPGLDDGSFRPGAHYRLQMAGQPRPDSIRSAQGRWLDAAVTFDVFVADLGHVEPGLPSVLRPTTSELPFLLRRPEVPLPVASDDPRLLVHFTLPLLPSSVTADAFRVQVLGSANEITPRSVKVVSSPLDDLPGSSVELDLGAMPRLIGGGTCSLKEGDWISVSVRSGGPLIDYRGQRPLPATSVIWSVIAGSSVPICAWPGEERGYSGDDGLSPGFEVRGARIVPRVRVEAGRGALGDFCPTRDTTLRPGELFDRGDGQLQVSEGTAFAFSSIDIPEGVTVTVDAQGGAVQLRATGGVRVAGQLKLKSPVIALPSGRFAPRPLSDLVELAPVSVVAAGPVSVEGSIVHVGELGPTQTALLLASATGLVLNGSLPLKTMLVAESSPGASGATIEGALGPAQVYPATFTAGLAPGSAFNVEALLPWKQLPSYVDGGLLQIEAASSGLQVEWQSTPADPIRGASPDLSAGRMGRWQVVRGGDVVVTGAGGFIRLRLRAALQSGEALPTIERLRVVEQR